MKEWSERDEMVEDAQYAVADILSEKKSITNYNKLREAASELCRALNWFHVNEEKFVPYTEIDLMTSEDFQALRDMLVKSVAKTNLSTDDRVGIQKLIIRLRRTEDYFAHRNEKPDGTTEKVEEDDKEYLHPVRRLKL